MQGYWKQQLKLQEQMWQAKVQRLQAQLEAARGGRRRRSPSEDPTPARSRSSSSQRSSSLGGGSPRGSEVRAEGCRLGVEIVDGPADGVRVVAAKGLCQKAGLRPNDVITTVTSASSTRNKAAFRQAIQNLTAGDLVSLTVTRDGEDLQVDLQL